MLLPLLLGAGVLLLVATSGKELSPLEKLQAMKESPAYKVGYKDGDNEVAQVVDSIARLHQQNGN